VKKTLALALGLSLLGMSANATTVFSDNFDANNYGLNTTPLGWTLNSGSVDIIGDGQFAWYGAGNYIDMNGSTQVAGSISTTLTGLVAGASYALDFDVGFNNGSGNNEKLSYSIGTLSGSYGPPIASGNSTFLHLRFAFIAGGTSAVLTFADAGNTPNDNGGPILDNVSVTAVPVPAAGGLLLSALGGVAMLRRRKKA
jgi:hypothetical protein